MIKELSISDYINKNKLNFESELIQFLSIPSVSADPKRSSKVLEAATFVKNTLQSAGADKVEVMETNGLPIVYGESFIQQNYPTLLIYGHYDVQPEDPIELWNTDPFKPKVIDGKIYARGACDDKAQMMIPIKAFEFLNQTKQQKYNIKFLFEGEEEIGSVSLQAFISENKRLLDADIALIVDTFLYNRNTPVIVYGVKGAAMMDIEIYGPEKDIHSGLYSGIVKNPAEELSKILGSIKDKNGKILIKGFYNDITPPSLADIKKIKEWASISKQDLNNLQIQSYEPTLEINGINSGYNGEGVKTIIPAMASAKISIRTAAGQNPNKLLAFLDSHIRKQLRKKDFTLVIHSQVGCSAAVMDISHRIFKVAEKACELNFKN
ncbi:MAG: M20/M25/M40 family metallo-hydrolase, partial [Flavobacteriales bacterium]|nr:M20/M25/M40 family metallo-hydrolase [Flavobacteriales bacterium]